MKIYSLTNQNKHNFIIDKYINNPFDDKRITEIEYFKGHLNLEKFQNKNKLDKQELLNIFRKLVEFLTAQSYEIAALISEETGIPVKDNISDINLVIDFLKDEEKFELPKDPIYLIEPKGNIFLNLSANEPIIISTIPLINALIAGNTVIIKPSSKSPSFAFIICSKLLELGIPNNQLYYLLLEKDLFYQIIENNPIDYVLSFGSAKTNSEIGSSLIKNGINIDLENEGNDWVYIEESDIDTEKLIKILIESFTKHNGQMCDSIKGIFVRESMYDDLLEKLKISIVKLKYGDPKDISNNIGALDNNTASYINDFINDDQKYYEELFNYSNENNIVRPTLIVNPELDSQIIKEGLFGPICFIKKVQNVEQIISIYDQKNDFGLGFSIFSNNENSIKECVKNIRVARININTNPTEISYSSPWGGIGKSGSMGPTTWMEKFTKRKVINNGQF